MAQILFFSSPRPRPRPHRGAVGSRASSAAAVAEPRQTLSRPQQPPSSHPRHHSHRRHVRARQRPRRPRPNLAGLLHRRRVPSRLGHHPRCLDGLSPPKPLLYPPGLEKKDGEMLAGTLVGVGAKVEVAWEQAERGRAPNRHERGRQSKRGSGRGHRSDRSSSAWTSQTGAFHVHCEFGLNIRTWKWNSAL